MHTKGTLLLAIFSSLLHAGGSHYQEAISTHKIKYIQYLFTDINGRPKEVMYPAAVVDDLAQQGFNFDGSSVAGMSSISESDMLAMPDMQTFAIVPWSRGSRKTARVLCDVLVDEETAFSADPRTLLKKSIEEARAMGFEFFVGPELEFYLCEKKFSASSDLTPCDTQAYFDCAPDIAMDHFKAKLFDTLHAQNVTIEKIHHEVGLGQYEMSFKYGNAVRIADQLIVAKQTIGLLANQKGLQATFMPKPFSNQNGNGMHIHFSLWDTTHNCNAFYDSNDPARLSATAKHFLAGVLAHITELNALFNPTINSYKRLVPGYEAPVNICWGTKNRSALIRIPRVNADQPNAVRAELRSGDPMMNPYLAFAALLQAGLDGIRNKRELSEPVEDNLYHLTQRERTRRKIKAVPGSLQDAIQLLEKSSFAKQILGENLHFEFVKNKQEEIADFKTSVTNWEVAHYLEG